MYQRVMPHNPRTTPLEDGPGTCIQGCRVPPTDLCMFIVAFYGMLLLIYTLYDGIPWSVAMELYIFTMVFYLWIYPSLQWVFHGLCLWICSLLQWYAMAVAGCGSMHFYDGIQWSVPVYLYIFTMVFDGLWLWIFMCLRWYSIFFI